MDGWTIRYTVKHVTRDSINSWEVWQTIADKGGLIESQSILVFGSMAEAESAANRLYEAHVFGPGDNIPDSQYNGRAW